MGIERMQSGLTRPSTPSSPTSSSSRRVASAATTSTAACPTTASSSSSASRSTTTWLTRSWQLPTRGHRDPTRTSPVHQLARRLGHGRPLRIFDTMNFIVGATCPGSSASASAPHGRGAPLRHQGQALRAAELHGASSTSPWAAPGQQTWKSPSWPTAEDAQA